MENKTRLGPWGEEIAARCLEMKGFEIVEATRRLELFYEGSLKGAGVLE